MESKNYFLSYIKIRVWKTDKTDLEAETSSLYVWGKKREKNSQLDINWVRNKLDFNKTTGLIDST